MPIRNIILLIFASVFILFIVWVSGNQSTPASNTETPVVNTTLTPVATTTLATTTTTTNIKPMTRATITTNKGVITLELFSDKTPKTVENFIKLANEGFYDGTRFHRVIKGFMIQGGDPLSKDTKKMDQWGTGGPGYKFADEINADNSNDIGTIAMANSGPNTNGSQFFINTVNNSFLNTKHTVFGKVTSGMDVVTAIENTPTYLPGQVDRPIDDMIIQKIVVK
ncbi:MAG: peptidylprolyl isomerase [Candidatus Pacebacteria bacterium]|nr:peptidylprolyl isomerase [Candidatus Paceibacterota bacterium]